MLIALERAHANVFFAEREWEADGQRPDTVQAARVDEFQGWLLQVLDRLMTNPTGSWPQGPRVRSLSVSMALHAPSLDLA
jgi:hypothetical protein